MNPLYFTTLQSDKIGTVNEESTSRDSLCPEDFNERNIESVNSNIASTVKGIVKKRQAMVPWEVKGQIKKVIEYKPSTAMNPLLTEETKQAYP